MLSGKRQQIVIYVLAGILAADFVLFGYLPSYRRINFVKQTIAAQAFVIAKASAESKQLPALKTQLEKLQKSTVNYERAVPGNRELGVFLHRIADLMNEHNLKEQMISPNEEIETQELNCIPVNIRCKGRLKQIFEFYRRLQKLDRLVRIEQVELVNDNDFNGDVSIRTKVFIYYDIRGKGKS